MSIEGHVQIAIDLNDTASAESCDALKKIRLASSDAITAGVAVMASGTCGTTAVAVDFSDYRGADGEIVSWDSYGPSTKIAIVAEPSAQLDWDLVAALRMTSRDNEVAVTCLPTGTLPLAPGPMYVKTIAGFGIPPATFTASYTVLMFREG